MTLCDPCGHTAGWERPEARAVSQATQRPSWKMSLAPWWLERLSPPRRVRGLKISHRLACPPPRMLGQPREQGHRACPPDLGQSATRTINLTQPPQCVYTLTQTHVCSQVHSEVHPNRHKHTCSHPPAHTFQQCMHTHTHTQLLHNPAAPEAPRVPGIKRQPNVPSQSTCGEAHGRNFTRPLKCPPSPSVLPELPRHPPSALIPPVPGGLRGPSHPGCRQGSEHHP